MSDPTARLTVLHSELSSALEVPKFVDLDIPHVVALLGPRFSASPRVRQARREARLREFYGVAQ